MKVKVVKTRTYILELDEIDLADIMAALQREIDTLGNLGTEIYKERLRAAKTALYNAKFGPWEKASDDGGSRG